MSAETDRIAALACRCVLRLGEPALPVNPLEMLKRCRGVYLHSQAAERMPEAVLGATVCSEKRREVLFDPRMPPDRLRLTMAHELGHVALRHDECTAREEREADFFARCLLVPPPLLDWLAARTENLCAEELAAVFGVPRSLARELTLPAPPVPKNLAEELCCLLASAAERRMPTKKQPGWHLIKTNINND